MYLSIEYQWSCFKEQVTDLCREIKNIDACWNKQTYIVMNGLFYMGILINILYIGFFLYICHTDTFYNAIAYIGLILKIIFLIITTYLRLNSFELSLGMRLSTCIAILVIIIFESFIDTPLDILSYSIGNYVSWDVYIPKNLELSLIGFVIMITWLPQKILKLKSPNQLNGIVFNNQLIDVYWGGRSDLTDSQVQAVQFMYEKDQTNFVIGLCKDIFIDSLTINGRTTIVEFQQFLLFFALLMSQVILPNLIDNVILKYFLCFYIVYTLINMTCRRIMDSGASIFWFFALFVPILNIYVLYLLFLKPSILYDKESNTIFYYNL